MRTPPSPSFSYVYYQSARLLSIFRLPWSLRSPISDSTFFFLLTPLCSGCKQSHSNYFLVYGGFSACRAAFFSPLRPPRGPSRRFTCCDKVPFPGDFPAYYAPVQIIATSSPFPPELKYAPSRKSKFPHILPSSLYFFSHVSPYLFLSSVLTERPRTTPPAARIIFVESLTNPFTECFLASPFYPAYFAFKKWQRIVTLRVG